MDKAESTLINVDGSPPKNDNKTIPSNSNQNSSTTDQRRAKKMRIAKLNIEIHITRS